MSARIIVTTKEGFRIAHVHQDLRKQGMEFLRSHYTASPGNQGYLYVVLAPNNAILGATLLGSTVSESQTRDIVAPPWAVSVVKRLYCADDSPVPESQLLRAAMRDVALQTGQTTVCAAYADPAAQNNGKPLLGYVYLAAGMAVAGETSHKRSCLLDDEGRVRSTRCGAMTYTRKNKPASWTWVDLPPARLWLSVVTPSHLRINDTLVATTQRWRKHQWRMAMAALPEKRRLAVRQFMDLSTWERLQRAGATPIDDPKGPLKDRGNHFRQAAWLLGADCNRTMAPIWVPYVWQQSLLFEEDVAGESTAACSYLPRQVFYQQQRISA